MPTLFEQLHDEETLKRVNKWIQMVECFDGNYSGCSFWSFFNDPTELVKHLRGNVTVERGRRFVTFSSDKDIGEEAGWLKFDRQYCREAEVFCVTVNRQV